MRHDSFKGWVDDTRSALLWIHGKHGSGKSHLAARVIEELHALTAETPDSTVAFVYCTSNPSSSTGMRLNSMLGSLFVQLCRNLPRDEEVDFFIPREGGYSTRDSPRRNELKGGIVKLVSKFRPCFIVVDGLDECSQWESIHFREFCSFIAELSKQAESSTKVLVLSRPNYPDIEKALADSVKIQVDSGFNSNDIQNYISKRVSEIRPDQTEEESEGLEEIKKLLLDQSDGMFLWARLKINDLEGSMEDMKEALETSSENLDDIYRKKLYGIVRQASRLTRDRALRALLWITTAYRPLSKVEMIEALSIKRGQKGLDSRTRLPVYQPVCTECADLVVEHNGAYSLIHASLGEFLKREFLSLHDYKILQNPNAAISEACLTYLNFEAFRTISIASPEELEEIQTKYPLLQYASCCWPSHFLAAKTDDMSLTLKDQVLDFLQNQLAVRVSLQTVYPVGFHHNDYAESNKPNALHIIAAFNLASLVEEIPHWRKLLNDRDHISFLPIDYAIAFNREESVVWLLDAYKEAHNGDLLIKALSEDCKFEILHECTKENFHRAVSRLLSLGFNCNHRDQWGETPLHDAARSGSVESLELLIHAGADVTAASDNGDTPLIVAAEKGNVDVMARLIESLPERASLGETQQHTDNRQSMAHTAEVVTSKTNQAGEEGHSIDSPQTCTPGNVGPAAAYVRYTNIYEHDALMCACFGDQPRAVEFLLDHGAEIRADRSGQTNAFHFAALVGSTECIKVLSSRYSESSMINAGSRRGNTPLQFTLDNKSSAATIALLEAGAQPGLRYAGSSSALSLAIQNGCYDIAELLITTYGVDATEPENEKYCAVTTAAQEGWMKIFELLPRDAWGSITRKFSSTLLHSAAENNHVEFIETLYSLVPDLDLVPRDRWDDTPWHRAAAAGAVDALAWISKVMPSALLLKGAYSRLPIHPAAYYGHLDCVKALLTGREDTVNAEDFERLTPLTMASIGNSFPVVDYLAENGANIDATAGGTCVAHALRTWKPRMARCLLGRGADCRTVDSYGKTLLHYAAATGDIDVIRQLLDNGCDPLAREYWGETALMEAAKRGWSEATKLLLSRKPEASEIRDHRGRTCIHLVCLWAAPPNVLEILLHHSPKLLLSVDNDGFDAMDCAIIAGRSDLLAILFDHGMPLNGSPESPWKPMDLAGCYGSIAVLKDLIKRGLSVSTDQRSLEDGRDGLSHATYYSRDATASLLLQNGADPTLRDCLGLCALDYASKSYLLQEVFQSHLRTHKDVDRKAQLAVLRRTIIDRSTKLLSTKSDDDHKPQDHASNLRILADALLHFRTETSVRYSKLALRALSTVSEARESCNFCSQNLDSAAFSVCRAYRGCEKLCAACHDDCLSPNGYSSLPISQIILDELGRSLRPVLAVFISFRPADILSLSVCLRSANLFQEWITAMLEAYSTFQRLNTSSSTLSLDTIAAWQILKLLQDVQNFEFLQGEEGTDVEKTRQEDFIISACQTLWDAYGVKSYRPDTEKRRPECRGHAHIQVPDLKSISEDNEQYIDSKGVLHQRFYEDIAQYYSDLRLEEVTDFIESDSVSVSKSEIAEDYEKVRNEVGPKRASFMSCFISQETAKKSLEKAFKEIWSKARLLFQKSEASEGNDIEREGISKKIRTYEIAWRTAQAILHFPFEGSLQEAERNRKRLKSQKKREGGEKDKAISEELETLKSPQRTLTIESRDDYDTASEVSAQESWKSAGEYLEHDQISDGWGSDRETWETCSES